MDKLVSIITPTYNSERYIAETIRSVQSQTYTNWEMLIVDDGSSDKTVETILNFMDKDNRISLTRLAKNSGASKARNEVIKLVKGDYMTFLDADDIWFSSFIETSVKTIQETGINFVFSSYKRANENLEFVYSDFIVPQKVTYTDILKTNSISCLTAFLNVKVLGVKQMPNILKRQDMGLWLKYLKEIPYAYGIQEPQAIYRIRQNSLSRNKKALVKYQWQFYREVERLSFLESAYYMIQWTIRGFLKYRN
ncbi:glycosyltransferase family 2 protein [Flavobacterium columnare NBRC 100251 = ATCC 23463]|uniref:Teichuronic acid biosynthesis n=2 Tax=Flavobacterium columnare TaxID=996 RepID=G8X8L1_FLACA|nr:glycosyltransferase family 2 protein [Flavobacterium columnare]AEW86462.1 teichuronic acid biosynthesis [Flavobacterium columnare ATCC 49512]AMO20384.1 glycosyltransferase family 2 protein [Flavobacterium columnare]ANO49644.1 teichuronic acid biosynthesis [Flavobacterium columnare]APT22420.1 glycosyl transferase [Flavobacterium columnare]AUX18345.1 glycosyl transferase [Flavobacterium columnare]